jgi:DNA topoisomerase-1
LRYVSVAKPGIARRRNGKGFVYVSPSGERVRDETTLTRIRSLVIPPAWTQVWICPLANGHLQATGHDIRGRKQYRYHPRWREARDETKYDRLLAFARTLPRIRRRVAADLRLPGLPRNKILAAVVRLLETTFIRVGNEKYMRDNGSYGLTTMRNKHVRVRGEHIAFEFRGKSGKQHLIELDDKRLASIIRRCRDLPGYELFQYVDESSVPQTVDSSAVNDYLRAIAGEDYTAKDFRTWAGTVLMARGLQELTEALMARGLQELTEAETQTAVNRNIVQAVKAVAQELGNTPAVCRKCYIHPRVIDAYTAGKLVGEAQALAAVAGVADRKRRRGLKPDEEAILALLSDDLAKARKTFARKRPSAARRGTVVGTVRESEAVAA